MDRQGFTVWFTGLPRSGKSTVARLVVERLRQRGYPTELLNASKIRKELNRSLGFSRDEIETNVRRLGYECTLLNRNGLAAVVTAVSPYRDVRQALRTDIPRFVEVYCHAPMDVLQARDTRGFFEKAKRGEIQHVAGVNAPYEEPQRPEVDLKTDQTDPETCADDVIATLESLNMIPRIEDASYTAEEEGMIKKRLRDLGYL